MHFYSDIRKNVYEFAGGAALAVGYASAAYMVCITVRDGYNGVFEYFEDGSLADVLKLGFKISTDCLMINGLIGVPHLLKDRMSSKGPMLATGDPEQIS